VETVTSAHIIQTAVDTATGLVGGGLEILSTMYSNPFGAIVVTLGLAGVIYGGARRFMKR